MSDRQFFIWWSLTVPFFLFVLFLPMEIYAAVKNPEVDTLSAWVWKLIGTKQGWTWRTTPGRLIVLIGLIVLATHLGLGWP